MNESAMRTSDRVLPAGAASSLTGSKPNVTHALPGMEKLILFGSRARGGALADTGHDIAVLVRDLSDRRHNRRVPSDLAYDQILSGFAIRPGPLPADYLALRARRTTEWADDIIRDGVEPT